MSEPANNPPADRSGITGTLSTALRQPSILRVMLGLAATIGVLVGMRVGAPILNPIFFAVILALLFNPIYSWLGRRGIPKPLALVIMLVGLTILFLGLFFILGTSIARFSSDIGSYTAQLNNQMAGIEGQIKDLGINQASIRNAVKPSDLTALVGTVLGGIADFLSNLFLILIIVLFLLAEGSSMMSRLHASVGRDHPQAERLIVFGRNVVRQLGLRAIVNLITGVGVTVLLFVLGVDFPVMWGILAFFLSFIPWIGLPIAVAPAVVLALAEHGLERALLVIAGVIVINVLAENLVSPMLMGRGLSLSPTFLFLGFTQTRSGAHAEGARLDEHAQLGGEHNRLRRVHFADPLAQGTVAAHSCYACSIGPCGRRSPRGNVSVGEAGLPCRALSLANVKEREQKEWQGHYRENHRTRCFRVRIGSGKGSTPGLRRTENRSCTDTAKEGEIG